VLLAAVALIFDATDRDTPYSVVKTGLLDEPSHFATTALCVLALSRFVTLRKPFVIAALIASVAIDLDHVPGYLGVHGFSPVHGGRPYPHSVATVLVLLVICAVSRRWRSAAAGAVFGLVTHFVRDICEGPPGVALFWPFSSHVFIAGEGYFWLFIGVALAIAVSPWPRAARRSGVDSERARLG
jgi:inner membrane protein